MRALWTMLFTAAQLLRASQKTQNEIKKGVQHMSGWASARARARL